MDAHFVTLLVMLWESRAGRFTMANAGSEPPLVCRGGHVLRLKVEGVPLGLLDAREYDDSVFAAQPGELEAEQGTGFHRKRGGVGCGRGRHRAGE